MKEPEWISMAVVLAIHEAQLSEHGGPAGVRDMGLLESAMARPRQIYAYSEKPTLARLAAAYAVGIAGNHAFLDGNRRTAWVVCATFLELNGRDVTADERTVVQMMLGVAAGKVKEAALAKWLALNSGRPSTH
jgi:death on curing protein